MPNNFPSIGFLALILPNAKIIDARRHPLDATLSCYRQLFAKGQPFTYDLTEIGEYYLQYQRMMDHWAEALPGKVLTVQYEAVVADLERRCAGCWISAACPSRMPACDSTRAIARCVPRARSRCGSPSTTAPSVTGAATSGTSTSC